MGKPTGFKDWPRVMPPRRDRRDRTDDWREFYMPQTVEQTRRQGGRCMDCGVPFCQQGCPLGNHIPDWNDLVYRDRWRAAYRRLDATNNFPEFTGRLCPAPCESACVLAINAPAVTIEQVEKEIVERAFAEGWVQPRPPETRTGKRVAIVGSGPAGLAAAQQLNRAGHSVTVFERDAQPGGLLRYGIPNFKLEKLPIDRRLEVLRAEGVRFEVNTCVGTDPSWPDLAGDHDAVLVAIGAQKHRPLDIPGRDVDGVELAMDYLSQQNRVLAGETIGTKRIDAAGKHVIVLGGGDTGSDCVGTALRQGAASVTTLQLWPAPSSERGTGNPWPQWPMVFRTSSSQEEGGAREFAVQATRAVATGGRISALECVEINMEGVGSGKRAVPIAGSAVEMPCDLLLVAIGFAGPESESIVEAFDLQTDDRGNLRVDADYQTSRPGVFAAGDAMRGASLIVWAIMDGREAARGIDARLRGGQSVLPSRGLDAHFGGPTHKVERIGLSVVSANKPSGSEVR